MKILVACEKSGKVREAFKKLGHEVWSCDLLKSDIDSPNHFECDVRLVLKKYTDWDLMIAHPPCTFMCNSGVSWLHKDDSRWEELRQAKEFFDHLWKANIKHICLENPIPHKYALLPPYTQIIQPYQFGHPERKATCLWLKNLPLLQETNNVYGEMKLLPKKESQRIHYTSPGKDRGMLRSITFNGIADAMAEQWGKIPLTSLMGCE